jgi:predicted DNA-binding transcriptional regulator AlpA
MNFNKLLSDRELSHLLSVSRSTLWRWASQGILPKPMKIGGASRWRGDEIKVFIDRQSDRRLPSDDLR